MQTDFKKKLWMRVVIVAFLGFKKTIDGSSVEP